MVNGLKYNIFSAINYILWFLLFVVSVLGIVYLPMTHLLGKGYVSIIRIVADIDPNYGDFNDILFKWEIATGKIVSFLLLTFVPNIINILSNDLHYRDRCNKMKQRKLSRIYHYLSIISIIVFFINLYFCKQYIPITSFGGVVTNFFSGLDLFLVHHIRFYLFYGIPLFTILGFNIVTRIWDESGSIKYMILSTIFNLLFYCGIILLILDLVIIAVFLILVIALVLFLIILFFGSAFGGSSSGSSSYSSGDSFTLTDGTVLTRASGNLFTDSVGTIYEQTGYDTFES